MSMLRATAILALTSILMLTSGGRAAAGLYGLQILADAGDTRPTIPD